MDPQARRTTWELLEELRADGVTVVLTTHYMDEAERLADQVHIIDRGRLVASGSPLELTRGGGTSDDPAGRHRAVPAARPGVAQAALGAGHRGDPARRAQPAGRPGPADAVDAGDGLRRGASEHGVLPESLTLGQRTLEDVFLELTGRELRREPRRSTPAARARRRCPGWSAPRPSMETRLMLRNGEQLLLAVVIPVLVLVGGVGGAERVGLDFATADRRRASRPACSRWR